MFSSTFLSCSTIDVAGSGAGGSGTGEGPENGNQTILDTCQERKGERERESNRTSSKYKLLNKILPESGTDGTVGVLSIPLTG